MELAIFLIDLVLLTFPIIYFIRFYILKDDLDRFILENKAFYRFLMGYLIGISGLYIAQVIVMVYLTAFPSNLYGLWSMFFFLIAIILLTNFLIEIDKRLSLTIVILFIYVSFIIIFNTFYIKPIEVISFTSSEAPILFISLVIFTVVPIIILLITKFLVKKREVRLDISEKDLKVLINYFFIALVIFAVMGFTLFFLTFDLAYIFSGFIDFTNINDKINNIFTIIFADARLQVATIFVALGAFVRGFGIPATKIAGNMVMMFLPLIFWLGFFFNPPPQELLDMFVGFDWFAKIFYILFTTMLMTMILAVFNVFSGIVGQ